jgi:hypothetical protein
VSQVIDRILYKLDELVRPFVHKILVVIEPLLIDEDYYARVEVHVAISLAVSKSSITQIACLHAQAQAVRSRAHQCMPLACLPPSNQARWCQADHAFAFLQGREIIANLSKAAGLATMIAAMRPDIDNIDEYVRNTTARAFSVVASALGIPALLPFLKAVCQSKKSWQVGRSHCIREAQALHLPACRVDPSTAHETGLIKCWGCCCGLQNVARSKALDMSSICARTQARHTGIKIVQQIAILLGCAVLPHLKALVDIVKHGLTDENQKVRLLHERCRICCQAACVSDKGTAQCLPVVTHQTVVV